MATPVLANGYFLRDTVYEIGSHYDSYHLKRMMMNSKPTDLGVIEYWAQTQQATMPLYTMADMGGKGVIPVTDPRGYYTWSTAIVNDMPHITRDVDPTNVTKGRGGQTFQIALSRRAFSHTQIITYDKYGGLELYIVDVPVISTGNDEYIYTVRLVNNDNTAYLDNKYLTPKTAFFKKTSARGEYGERWADINTRAGMREFYNFVGNAEANFEYSISSRANAMMKYKGNTNMGGVPVKEIWKIRTNNPNDPSTLNIESQAERIKQVGLVKALKEGMVDMSFVTSIEQAGITQIANDIEDYLMWGQGGRITQDGPDDIRLTTGLWRQMDNSFKRVYNIGTFDLNSVLKAELFNFYNGRVDFTGPDPKRQVIVQTGMAGMQQANDAILSYAVNSGLVINGSDVGAIKGSGMDLSFGYAYTSYTIPFLANVKFVVNPALDPVVANDVENPYINGFRLSSYAYIIWDVTANGGSDNIRLLKRADDEGLVWFYQNGTCDYMGRTEGFASVGDFNGYRVKMRKQHMAVQCIDPTKILKIVPYNPYTGRAFGS